MNPTVDARDFGRGAKRVAKDFRRVLRTLIDTSDIDTTELFDNTFRADVNAIIRYLSHGYEAVNAIGFHRAAQKPPHVEQAFFLFHEALNLAFVALRTIRGGSVIASDGVLRQALELASVAYQVATDASGDTLKKFLQGELQGPRAISVAKKIYQPIGRLYGALSNSSVHASSQHIHHSISPSRGRGEQRRIRIGASFDPGDRSKFKLGLIRIERVAVAIIAVIEAGLFDYLDKPRFWRRAAGELEWVGDLQIERRMNQAERDQRAIEQPYLIVYSWADPEDRAEVERLFGGTEGDALRDVTRLRELAAMHETSFVVHYMLGAALQDAGDFVGAASEFEKAWTLRMDGYDVWSRLEIIYTSRGTPRRLEDFYLRSLKRDPEDYTAVHNLGMLYSRMKDERKALECFNRAHAFKPDRFMATYNAANALLRLGRYQEAIDMYRHAAEREPDNPDPWHSAGVAYVHLGDLLAAYRAFRRALFLDSGYLASWANLAGVCRELGLRRRALACAIRAQQLAPGDERMIKLVAECREAVQR